MKEKTSMTIWQAFAESWRGIDLYAWPGVIMFLLLIVIEAGVNMIASIPDFGIAVSVGVGLLFGVFLGMWHIISERPNNSKYQDSVVTNVKYAISTLSIILIVVNLIRVEGNIVLTTSVLPDADMMMSDWDYLAIAIIGIAFAIHLIAYQLWHGNDEARQNVQAFNRGLAAITKTEDMAKLANRKAELRLKMLDEVLARQDELRTRYAHLPKEQLDRILATAKAEIEDAFERRYNIDVNEDGKVGGTEVVSAQRRPAFASDAEMVGPKNRNGRR